MFSAEIRDEIEAVAAALAVGPAALLAVVEVESGGALFATVEGRLEPLIRFEGHYFDRRLDAGKRALARAQGLAAPQAAAVANPRTQQGRWKLLAKAAAIDREAAYESVSWGAGQVMGSHWAWLGYACVDDLVAEARSGAGGQVRLMARYIDRAGLVPALAACDWHAFARGYNGPGYRRNRYHDKLAEAFRRRAAGDGPLMLRLGVTGRDVRRLQEQLSALGHAIAADGIFGAATENAVRAFQAASGLAPDGVAGPLTMAALASKTVAEAASAARGHGTGRLLIG